MPTIFVDDISLLAEPRFLTVEDPKYTITTTREAIENATAWAAQIKGDAYVAKLLQTAITRGTLAISQYDADVAEEDSRYAHLRDLPRADRVVILAAAEAATTNVGAEVWVSMFRENSAAAVTRLGLRAGPPNIIVHAVLKGVRHEVLDLEVRAFRKQRTFGKLMAITLFLGAILVAGRTFFALQRNVTTVSPFNAAVGALLVGLGLFVFRGRSRRDYGMIEIAFGCIIAATAFVPSHPADQITFARLFQALSGVYIVVRGLDNVGVSLKGTPAERWWEQLF